MSRRLVVRGLAEVDIDNAAGWYELERPGLGLSFIVPSVTCSLAFKKRPTSFLRSKVGRRGIINRFPYGVYFTVDGAEIVVLAVVHLHRHPDSWKRG